ncbi:MAG: phosphoenolpyruvate carboxykinase (GTP) [Tepidisphaeraceae bacterium]
MILQTMTTLTASRARKPLTDTRPHADAQPSPSPTVQQWIKDCIGLCRPDRIVVCNGSPRERKELVAQGVREGVFIPLNQDKRPGCYLHRSNPNDVARTEQSTFICTPEEKTAGPTNNWLEPQGAYAQLSELFRGCMAGRTMYVIPFVMGPIGSPLAKVGVQLTDSLYVAVNMGIMTRMGLAAWKQFRDGQDFTRCLHSVGDCHPDRRFVCHFPQDNTVWSFGSGYGGNALLGKKCLALRLAGYQGSREGWMAEHMLISGVATPGQKAYVAAAFPSACGKTNFAMLVPPEKYRRAGWKITTVGDDIAWMWVDEKTGRLRAINPEAGYFGVVPGTNEQTNPNAMACMSHDTIFTNVALLPDGDVWWEGKTPQPPQQCIDWKGNPWTPASNAKAAHPNSRFTAPMSNNPALDESANDPNGVEISAIIFGGRRAKTIPLVFQAFNWMHGVFVGANLGSETTAAAAGQVGVVRRDPMAMLPFMGYNIGEYLDHWLRMGKKMSDPPRIFHVNWFRKNDKGEYLLPGFGENVRILKWIIDRCRGMAVAVESPIGWMPLADDIDLEGIAVSPPDFQALQAVDNDAFRAELIAQEEWYLKLGADLPGEMTLQRQLLSIRL